MAESNTALLKRVISGFLGAVLILALGYFFGSSGLQVVCLTAILLGVREYARMIFPHLQMPTIIVAAFWIWAVAALLVFLKVRFDSRELAFLLIGFSVSTLWMARGKAANENLLGAIGLGVFGLVYCVFFPFFAVKLVALDHGGQWFLFLLLVVFFGDSFAYFGGRFWGRRKLMENVSPKKTWEGAVSGLLGSSLAGIVHTSIVFPGTEWFKVLAFCLVCGICAQSGDLLMSLIKRVAQVKDSGHLMPGHGGALDRLDGIFIACPLVFAFALYVRPV